MGLVRYPAGPLTPHGAYHVLKGDVPMVWLRAHDDSVQFDLMGGRAIPDRTRPESVQLDKEGFRGLIPPWATIDQKGATEDGVTFVDALYDPIEVTARVTCRGRDRTHLRRVVRDLIASLDAKQTSTLNFWTHDLGHWWSDVRWFKTAPDANLVGAQRKHPMTLVLRADNGFWRTQDSTDLFAFAFESMTDTFAYTAGSAAATSLGANWPLRYTGAGGGYVRANGSQVLWIDDPDDLLVTQSREVVAGPYKDFATDTDYQVVSVVFGNYQEWTLPDGAENHIWLRMGRNVDGTWNGDGVRASVGVFGWELARYNNFVKTVMRSGFQLLPPIPGDKLTAIAGLEGNARRFQILRNGLPLVDHVERGTGSALGADYRGIGWGMRAAAALIGQATPGSLRKVSAGDNTTVSQEGYLRRVNPGDQPMYDTYTVFGPGLFRFWLGPGASDYVEFGPLLPNQVAFIDTDPRRRVVQDLTSVPPTPQELNIFQQALKSYLDFAGGMSVPLNAAIGSQFGIVAPQGPMYSLLSGRFTTGCAIPPKSPGNPAQTYYVKVAIDNGTAESKIIAAGTPRRRYPL